MTNVQATPATPASAASTEFWALGLGHSLVIGHWSLGVRGRHSSLIQWQWGCGEGGLLSPLDSDDSIGWPERILPAAGSRLLPRRQHHPEARFPALHARISFRDFFERKNFVHGTHTGVSAERHRLL